jgi:hypothetical protein
MIAVAVAINAATPTMAMTMLFIPILLSSSFSR